MRKSLVRERVRGGHWRRGPADDGTLAVRHLAGQAPRWRRRVPWRADRRRRGARAGCADRLPLDLRDAKLTNAGVDALSLERSPGSVAMPLFSLECAGRAATVGA